MHLRLRHFLTAALAALTLLLLVGLMVVSDPGAVHAQYPPGTLPPVTGVAPVVSTVPPTTVAHHIAFTGAMISEVAGVGIAILLTGVVLLLIVRRRQRPQG